MDLFKKTLVPVTQVLEDGDVEINEVDELVLVGGSTRIPKVRQMLSAMFGEKQPASGVNPDEAVAYGASVQGGILTCPFFFCSGRNGNFPTLTVELMVRPGRTNSMLSTLPRLTTWYA